VEPSTSTLKERARRLRREQTDAESKLWARLRSRQLLGFKFRRQFVVGTYITDFCCFQQRLIVEVDGGQHGSHTSADQRRTAFLVARGYRVLRFWDNEVMRDIDTVLEEIVRALSEANAQPQPSPFPSPGGRGLKEEKRKVTAGDAIQNLKS
jgi:adenine-specific DNA-methyltransferase